MNLFDQLVIVICDPDLKEVVVGIIDYNNLMLFWVRKLE